ncbi:MAG: DNA polymerase III subunit alpha [Phycisphaerales bacterium]|nr:DNA polymerase III subunit alpha [Phycisphaerales bacterium]
MSNDPETPDSPQFVHLHLHSEYSLLDGANRVDRLVERVKQLGMSAVALTDHGNLHGAIQFYTACKDAGIKPILGIEAYIAIGDRTDRTPTGAKNVAFHLVLLAENNTGWEHLVQLSSDAYLNGFYYKPRMDKTTLAQWSDGLIAINGHLGSSIAHYLQRYVETKDEAHYKAAREEALWHAKTFRPNENGESRFFIELQRHDTPEQEAINPHLIRLARELDVPLICDNDAHFLLADDHDAHDVLCCISMGRTREAENRLHYSPELYVKGPQQMAELFSDVPEAVHNTVRVAERCCVDLDFSHNHAPIVQPVMPKPGEAPAYDADTYDGNVSVWFADYCSHFRIDPFDETQHETVSADDLAKRCDETLRALCEAGLIWRYGKQGITDEIRSRLDRELTILADKRISAYFLIVWDFVNWARQQGIPAVARGSGVGTMVGYAVGLSNACPVKYGLLFERFTDPDRSEYPDIDVDICQDGRAAVINYVREKYGHVAQIITFGTLKARAAIRDVGRVLNMDLKAVDRIAKLVPEALGMTLDKALQQEPDLRKAYHDEPDTHELIDLAQRLEGQARHASVHAAGIVIATRPLQQIVPLYRHANSDDVITQWDGPTCEKVGLLKMDFLGLRTLSIIERAKELIRQSLTDENIRHAVGLADDDPRDPLDLDRLTYDDQKVFELFRRGDTAGIFQFESGGMRRLLADVKPDRLEDLIASNALFRPGPMELIPEYGRRKHGREAVPTVHEIVDRFTQETYGIMVYQEQVMQIVHSLGDIPLRAAYTLIKAISKKKEDVINRERPRFLEGAQAKGLKPNKAKELFELILKFAGYGFNKSHSTGYAIIAYQTAYLKTYFPAQYMAAVLTYESQAQKVANWIAYLDDCRKAVCPDHTEQSPHIGIDVAPPDVNHSQYDFSVIFDADEPHDNVHGHIRFGLNAIKGTGSSAIRAIVDERCGNGPYESLHDFCERLPSNLVNKATIEALVTCGAFDSIHGEDNRAAMVAAIESAVSAATELHADKSAGQMNFFGVFEEAAPRESQSEPTLPKVTPWTTKETLDREKEILGFYLSAHPLDECRAVIDNFSNATTASIKSLANESMILIGGQITRIRPVITKKGDKMAIVTIEDLQGQVEGVLFPKAFAACGDAMQTGRIVILDAKVDLSRGDPQIIIEKVCPIEDAERRFATRVTITVDADRQGHNRADLDQLAGLIRSIDDRLDTDAAVPLMLDLVVESKRVTMQASQARLSPTPLLRQYVTELLGEDAYRVHGGKPIRKAPPRRGFARTTR